MRALEGARPVRRSAARHVRVTSRTLLRPARIFSDKKEHGSGERMSTSLHIPRWSQAVAVGLLLLLGEHAEAVADPPATATGSAPSGSASDAQSLEAKGSFMSSLKQAFSEDLDKEVVRGHFDVGSAPDTHRYYCLVNPKTGKSEPNGVAGQLVMRHDKMTGIKGAAVTFFSCAEAEQKGILVTTGYVLSAEISSKIVPPAPVQKPVVAAPAAAAASAPVAAAPSTPVAAAAVAPAAAAPAPVAPAVAVSAEEPLQAELTAVFARFIAGQNAHDRALVSEVLLDSKDFVWAQYGGGSIWGYKEAMEAFAEAWKGTWRLDPQLKALRIASVAPDAAVLITPLLFTSGDPGKEPATVSIRWGGVFVKTKSGWRIASIFITPRAPKGG
jgi:ketosteroid isomerase-like protein